MHSAAGVIKDSRIDDYAPELPSRVYGVCEEFVKGLEMKTLHLQPCNSVH